MASPSRVVSLPLRLQVGDIRVLLLSDGVFRLDGGASFGVVPRTLWERVIQPDTLNLIPTELRSLLIESDDGPILVDTGNGDKLSPKMREHLGVSGERRLLGQLSLAGYEPEDIRIVINTHLHGDHCGGNTFRDDDGRLVPTFPHATYLVQRLELADATHPNERTRNAYFAENFLPLTDLCQSGRPADPVLRILDGNTQIASGVRTLVTPGHTRAHQVVIVESRGESAAFLADAVGWAVSLERLAWVPAFDVEPLVSMESKRALRDWALQSGALLLFQHDIAIIGGRIHQEGDRWHVEPELSNH
jgi:glyoxylase-like metal-dependent hydrolase (beta-lactamase superfamily II)